MVIRADGIVNPSVRHPVAQEDTTGPIATMPAFEIWKTSSSMVTRRTMARGNAVVDNPLFHKDNHRMLFGDAKKMLDEVLGALKV